MRDKVRSGARACRNRQNHSTLTTTNIDGPRLERTSEDEFGVSGHAVNCHTTILSTYIDGRRLERTSKDDFGVGGHAENARTVRTAVQRFPVVVATLQ